MSEITLEEQLLDSRALAQALSVSQATVSRMRSDRSGPAFILIRGVARYRPSAVLGWIRAQERLSVNQ